MTPSYLSDFLNERRGAGPQIAGSLGLVQVVEVYYVKGSATERRRRSIRPKNGTDNQGEITPKSS